MAAMSEMKTIAPHASPLPEGPAKEYFTAGQWLALMSIMDTVIPSIHRESPTANNTLPQLVLTDKQYHAAVKRLKGAAVIPPAHLALDDYLNEKPSDIPAFQDLLLRTLVLYSSEDTRRNTAALLSALNTRLGSLLLTGYGTPIHQQPISVRTAILDGWRQSYIPALRRCFKLMTAVGKQIYLKTSATFSGISGFPRAPSHYKPGHTFKYEFLQFPAAPHPEILEVDVVVVGSGCGGAVAAKNISEAGHQVLVVDKSYYYPPSHLPMSELQGGIHLFENGGVVTSDDASINVIAGSAWGGGGTINWSASLQTQDFVRKEWAEDRGLKFFGTSEFQASLDRVCGNMGVGTDRVRHNHGNQKLLEGSRRLGYHAKVVPQNTGGKDHECGHCALGCGAGQKQGPSEAWLPAAAKAGATFIEGFEVQRVLFEERGGVRKALGVEGLWKSRDCHGGVDGPTSERIIRKVIVKAKRVVMACGTLRTPLVLLNSGLTNKHIGRNLHLHPVNFVVGVFKEEVRPWEGAMLTSVCTSFENLDEHGHGVKLEATCMLPSFCLSLMDWRTGLDFKLQALKYRHTNAYIAIGRDRDTGRVYPDPVTGQPKIDYSPSQFDRAHVMTGVLALAKVLYATGAEEIHACIGGGEPFVCHADADTSACTDAHFEAWLKSLEVEGNSTSKTMYSCAHQMGTSRMSTSAAAGVVDPAGRVWGTEGLYVCDASVFPSASGVNPMVTNMAISDWTSRGISRDLGLEQAGKRVTAKL
ncbi:MAG: hypothetical protein M1818_004740 [Claussenomyces sp. TS43310]|nr:MAG: hypothetical protein M1818_004740 [Claussenomyces sp. TS43310]